MTLFIDIDGTLIHHEANPEYTNSEILLKNVKQQINIWKYNGYKIILTTARSKTNSIHQMLQYHEIKYDDLITNLPSGPRVLINDVKPSLPFTLQANSINLERNKGFDNLTDLKHYINNDEIIKTFKGASFSKTYLIKDKYDKFKVRKIIFKNYHNKRHYNKLKLQLYNLNRFKCYYPLITPEILHEEDNDFYYYFDMEYLQNYKMLSEITDNSNVLEKLFDILKHEVYSMKKPNKNKNWVDSFIRTRIDINEYEKLSENIKKILNMDTLLINGIKCCGIKLLLQQSYNFFSPQFLSPIHGDLTFENILYRLDLNDIKLIDMDGGDYIDAPELDFGKLLQSDLSKYELWSCDDNVIKNIDYENKIIDTVEYVNTEEIDKIILKYYKWKDIINPDSFFQTNQLKKTGIFYLVLHLLRMIPYRFKHSENQAIYAIKESIYWLNYINKC